MLQDSGQLLFMLWYQLTVLSSSIKKTSTFNGINLVTNFCKATILLFIQMNGVVFFLIKKYIKIHLVLNDFLI